MKSVVCAAILAGSVSCGAAQAEFVVPDGLNFPWVRGASPNSAYAEWDTFTSVIGPNNPDRGSFAGGAFPGSAPAWNVYETSGGSFLTGGGNIYCFGGPGVFHVVTPNFDLGSTYGTNILLQVRTLGTEVFPPSVNIGGEAPIEVRELWRVPLGGPGGFLVETLYRWELDGNESSYLIRFDGMAPHMSLDALAVDTFALLPSPAGAALLAFLAAPLLRRGRVRG